MEQYVLYMALKDMVKEFNAKFKYSFNDMNSNLDNVVGIYIKGAEPSPYRTLGDGKYHNLINRVQFLLQGGLDNNSLMDCMRLGSYIRDALISASNRFIVIPSKIGYTQDRQIVLAENGITLESITIVITKVDLISDLVSLGKSEQGRPRYSINFKITYEMGGN